LKKIAIIKKKIKIVKQQIHDRLHREPYYVHPKLKFIPNIILNLISILISLIVIGFLINLLIHFVTNKFYHLD
jgi:hypothetical protein